jgi:Tfp pilus assembly major pilin PilA
MPAALLPLVGAAYARAREYTCDRHGLAACDDLKSRTWPGRAGGRRQALAHLNVSNYIAQAQQTSGFWMSFHELVGDYPWLVKRMAVVRALAPGRKTDQPAPPRLAYLLALFVPRLGPGGGGSVLAVVALIGILAAVAIPAYSDYTAKARMAQAVLVGKEATGAVERYIYANGSAPDTLGQAGYAMDDPSHAVQTIDMIEGNGVVRVFPADLNYRGKAIVFTPSVDENKRVVWRCASDEIPAHVLPPECRN